jgi:hypothetical protein
LCGRRPESASSEKTRTPLKRSNGRGWKQNANDRKRLRLFGRESTMVVKTRTRAMITKRSKGKVTTAMDWQRTLVVKTTLM